MEKMSIFIWIGIFVLIAFYFYPTLENLFRGEKTQTPEESRNLDELIENKKKLLLLNNPQAGQNSVESILLKEAEWGAGTEMNKLLQTLQKYYFNCDLSDISLSIKHFFAHPTLKNDHTTMASVLSVISTHLCLFHLTSHKSVLDQRLGQKIGPQILSAEEMKNLTLKFLQVSKDLSEDRAGLSKHIYQKMAQYPAWKDFNSPFKEMLKMLETKI